MSTTKQNLPNPHLIRIPELCLVLLIGSSGSGKSTFAKKHFQATEILSSDYYRGVVSDDENSQDASADAFEVLHLLTAKRLARGLLTVIDATNLKPEARAPLLRLARIFQVEPVAIVLDVGTEVCHAQNEQRPDRVVASWVVDRHAELVSAAIKSLQTERVKQVFVLRSREEIDNVTIERLRLPVNMREHCPPFDFIGDVHGCFDELLSLMETLGYLVDCQTKDQERQYVVTHPENRRLVFVGDLVDRGPKVPEVLRLVMDMVESGVAFTITGNHDDKLRRQLRGNKVNITHGLAETLQQLEQETDAFRERVSAFLERLSPHFVLDRGKIVVAHGGLKKELHGRVTPKARSFALYGDTTGEKDENGLPVRRNWAADYDGKAIVVYGHTPVEEPMWVNRTINIDTGCVFGGKLTALRYPERKIVSVLALKKYAEAKRAFLTAHHQEPVSKLEGNERGHVRVDLPNNPRKSRGRRAAARARRLARGARRIRSRRVHPRANRHRTKRIR